MENHFFVMKPSTSFKEFKNDCAKLFIFSVMSRPVDGCTSLFSPFTRTMRIGLRGTLNPISTSGHIGIKFTCGFSFSTKLLAIIVPSHLTGEKVMHLETTTLGLENFLNKEPLSGALILGN